MPRFLIVGGGCRGRRLAAELVGEGHAARITARTERSRAAIEGAGAECWIGDPDRLATLRGALDGVTVACWLLATAAGTEAQLRALHDTRLEFFLSQTIDSTVRGFLYEAHPPDDGAYAEDGRPSREMLEGGETIVRAAGAHNSLPVACLRAQPVDIEGWLAEARSLIASLLDPARA